MNFNHIRLAHLIWGEYLKPGMIAVDATLGNGHDTLFLAKKVLCEGTGWIHAFDIQEKALSNAERLLKDHPSFDRITLHHASHETFPIGLSEVDFFAYNLGYLPGGDKNITTLSDTTLKSLKNALTLLRKGGMLSIMLYHTHNQGAIEKEALLPWLGELPSSEFFILMHSPLNIPNLPILITLQRRP